jgi:hypothetical protein
MSLYHLFEATLEAFNMEPISLQMMLTIPIHTALIFKEQAKVKKSGIREKYLAQIHYSIQHIEGYDLLSYKDDK